MIANQLSCHCGVCSLTLNDPVPRYSVLCACQDCRQALRWAAKYGGKAPEHLIKNVYLRSDISGATGKTHFLVTKLRADNDSVRVFCKECYSVIGVDHHAYENNVFLVMSEYCSANFDISIEPKAVLFLQDYPDEIAPVPSDTIPVFHSLKYPQERARLRSIEPISETLAPPKTPAIGISFRDLIADLPIRNLNLKPGANP